MSKARFQVFAEGIFYSKIKYRMQVYGNVFNLERYKETGSRYSSFIINSRGTRAMSTREEKLLITLSGSRTLSYPLGCKKL